MVQNSIRARTIAPTYFHFYQIFIAFQNSSSTKRIKAEKVGFELTDHAGRSLVLETSALNHSAISPGFTATSSGTSEIRTHGSLLRDRHASRVLLWTTQPPFRTCVDFDNVRYRHSRDTLTVQSPDTEYLKRLRLFNCSAILDEWYSPSRNFSFW